MLLSVAKFRVRYFLLYFIGTTKLGSVLYQRSFKATTTPNPKQPQHCRQLVKAVKKATKTATAASTAASTATFIEIDNHHKITRTCERNPGLQKGEQSCNNRELRFEDEIDHKYE